MTIEEKYNGTEFKCQKCGSVEIYQFSTVFELGRCQNAFNQLTEKNKKLIEFVKHCADQEYWMRQFLNKHAIDFKDDLDDKATKLLKEIGEA